MAVVQPSAAAPPTGSAGGDLTGSYPNPTVAKINGFKVGIASVTLTSAQVLALHTTPITIVAAPGAGQAITLVSGLANYTFGGTAYTDGGGTIQIAPASFGQIFSQFASAGFWDQASSQTHTLPLASVQVSVTGMANQALQIRQQTANPTLGNGTVTVTVQYVVVPVS